MERGAKRPDRTLTEEEFGQRDVEKLKEVEEKRQKRMRGELSDGEDDGQEEDDRAANSATNNVAWLEEEEDEDFKLGSGIRTRPTATELGFDDEDDFIVEDDLLASGSDLEPIESEEEDSSSEEDEEDEEDEDDQDDEFTKGLLDETEAQDQAFSKESNNTENERTEIRSCPETLQQLLDISRALLPEQIPTLIQKVRIIYHPKLASENKAKLASFSRVLIQYLVHLSNNTTTPSWASLESIIRRKCSFSATPTQTISVNFISLACYL